MTSATKYEAYINTYLYHGGYVPIMDVAGDAGERNVFSKGICMPPGWEGMACTTMYLGGY